MNKEQQVAAEIARLASWRCEKIEIAGLFSRNPVAHKWKAFTRSIILRELVYWRFHDLLEQTHLLGAQGHALGARILFRSALETLAMLVFLNYKMQQVLDEKITFQAFSDSTSQLIIGSKDKSTKTEAINILTVLDKCGATHPALVKLHQLLSESAHPNYDGLLGGYSDSDPEELVTSFFNSWKSRWADSQYEAVLESVKTFEHEYNEVWPPLFERLEKWVEENDARLESEKVGI